MRDSRNVGAVTAYKHQAIRRAVHAGQRALELTMQWTLAANHAAPRHRGAVALDRAGDGGSYFRMAGEAEVIIVGEGDVLAAVDLRRVARDAFVHAEIDVADTITLAERSHRGIERMMVEAIEGLRQILSWPIGRLDRDAGLAILAVAPALPQQPFR